MNGGWGISYKIALRWMPLYLIDDKSTLVQVMAWCHQASSHYLNQCWPRSMSTYGVTRLQRVKHLISLCQFQFVQTGVNINGQHQHLSPRTKMAASHGLGLQGLQGLQSYTLHTWHMRSSSTSLNTVARKYPSLQYVITNTLVMTYCSL